MSESINFELTYDDGIMALAGEEGLRVFEVGDNRHPVLALRLRHILHGRKRPLQVMQEEVTGADVSMDIAGELQVT